MGGGPILSRDIQRAADMFRHVGLLCFSNPDHKHNNRISGVGAGLRGHSAKGGGKIRSIQLIGGVSKRAELI